MAGPANNLPACFFLLYKAGSDHDSFINYKDTMITLLYSSKCRNFNAIKLKKTRFWIRNDRMIDVCSTKRGFLYPCFFGIYIYVYQFFYRWLETNFLRSKTTSHKLTRIRTISNQFHHPGSDRVAGFQIQKIDWKS